jgi:transcription initiation factor IIE alpha subunit
VRSQEPGERRWTLKSDGYTCPECGITLDADQLARALKEAEGGVEKLKGEIAKLKKRLGF